MLPIVLVALIKIVLVIGGLMTAAAYLVLGERWIAAWIQDRLGPNRVGIPLTKIRMFGLGQPLADGVKFLFKAEYTPAHVDKGLVLLRPHDDLRHGDRGLRRHPLRQSFAGRTSSRQAGASTNRSSW